MAVRGATRSATIVRSVLGALELLGLDMEALCERTGLDARAARELQGSVPLSLYNALWQHAHQLSGDDLLGARVATVIASNLHEALLGAVEHSATLGDAIIRLARLGHVVGTGFGAALEIDRDDAILRAPHRVHHPLHVQATLCQLSVIGLVGCRLTGRRLHARELRLTHPTPFAVPRLCETFGGRVVFGAEHDALVIDSRALHLRVIGSDEAKCEALEAQAQACLREAAATPSFTQAVLGLLSSGFGDESIEQLASRLNLTSRTVARKLAAEGTTYQKLRDGLREQRAKEYLRGTDRPATDIGLRLGFSDGTAFTRAFKRWTGLTPSAYREAG